MATVACAARRKYQNQADTSLRSQATAPQAPATPLVARTAIPTHM